MCTMNVVTALQNLAALHAAILTPAEKLKGADSRPVAVRARVNAP